LLKLSDDLTIFNNWYFIERTIIQLIEGLINA